MSGSWREDEGTAALFLGPLRGRDGPSFCARGLDYTFASVSEPHAYGDASLGCTVQRRAVELADPPTRSVSRGVLALGRTVVFAVKTEGRQSISKSTVRGSMSFICPGAVAGFNSSKLKTCRGRKRARRVPCELWQPRYSERRLTRETCDRA